MQIGKKNASGLEQGPQTRKHKLNISSLRGKLDKNNPKEPEKRPRNNRKYKTESSKANNESRSLLVLSHSFLQS